MKPRARPLLLALGVAAVVAAAAGAATYPNPPFDFAHPGALHADPDPGSPDLLSPASGNDDRALLVVLGRFTDVPDPPGVSAASIQQLFFGGFPSVTDYFRAESLGALTVSAAQESDGTANDGVVEVNLGLRTTFNGTTEEQRGRQIVNAADPFINYAQYDQNNDGRVDARELLIFHVFEAQPVPGDTNDCGATRGIGAGSNDGKNLGGRGYSSGTTLTNLMTHVHELDHQALGHNDGSYQVGLLDVTGATCPPPTNPTFSPLMSTNSWHKLHFGWVTPTVVSRDGYYTVDRWDTTGQAYLLYDPDRGTQDYFLVENRRRTAGTYERDTSDSGLVIWRVDERRFAMPPPEHMVLMRPDGAIPPAFYGGATDDAWDPSDPQTTQRTMSRPWGDGTASNVAVRAIGDAGGQQRAYFDVRGPGVLVDTYALQHATPPDVTLGENGSINVPVMNTGEASDTFAFTATGLPGGWTATTDTRTLGAGAGATATFSVKPPLTAATGSYTLTATGTSTTDGTVTSSSTFRVNVVRRPTTIVYTGALTADYHDPAQVSAVLTDTISGAPLGGKTVDFDLGTQSASATTDAAGTASASIFIEQTPGTVGVSASFDGDATYEPDSDSETFTITREQTTTTYIGPTVILFGGTGVTLKAQLLEEGTVAPVPFGQTITLSLGGQSCTGTTDASGIASCMLTYTGPLGLQPLGADFAGDTYYLPSADTAKTATVFAFPTRGVFVLGDRTVAAAGPTTTVTWWDAQWAKRNSLSGGSAPSAFKGFAESVVLPASSPPTVCGGTWTTSGGASAPPVSGVPAYMGVVVATSVTKSGSTISGNYVRIVVVRTDPGYGPSPGHAGTGTIVATFCP
jgi:M6 family metalloprotease-like protein